VSWAGRATPAGDGDGADGGCPDASDAAVSPGALFTVLWEALADILGTAATAILVRRAARRALPRCPELAALSIRRESLDYLYAVPPAWQQPGPDPPHALCDLARELCTLLGELTGAVVVKRLAHIPALRDAGIVPRPAGSSGTES